MDYQMMSTIAIVLVVVLLAGGRILKRKKEKGKVDYFDLLTIAAPMIQQALLEVQEVKEKGEMTEEDFQNLVTKQLRKLIVESDLGETEKSLLSDELVSFLVKTALTNFHEKKEPQKK